MIYSNCIKYVALVEPQARINNTAVTVSSVDRHGFDYANIEAIVGANDIGFTIFKLQESDDNTNWADVINGDYSVGTLLPGNTPNVIYGWNVDLRGRKRYLRIAATVGNGASGLYLTVVAMLSRAEQEPFTAASGNLAGLLTL